MDSALSPREIQSRIRSGESLDDVASAAGVPAEQIEPFAAPVLAEREHVVGQAQQCPVRRRGESSSARSLRQVVREHLQHRGIDSDVVDWDAWREPDRRWKVVARYDHEGAPVEARFAFDPRGRFSTALDDQARALIGEPQPNARPPMQNPDDEPTVELDDERRSRPTPHGRDAQPAQPRTAFAVHERVEVVEEVAELHRSVEETHDDPIGHESQLDVLYDMLGRFDEDSVNIYADLQVPWAMGGDPEDGGEAAALEQAETDEAAADAHEDGADIGDAPLPEPDHESGLDALPEAAASVETDRDETVVPDEPSADDEPSAQDAWARDGDAEPPRDAGSADADDRRGSPGEPEQDALVDLPAAPTPKPKKRKGRASIPSWDEIMFGGPKPGQGS